MEGTSGLSINRRFHATVDCIIPWEVDLSYVRRTADYESKSKDSTQLFSMVPASVLAISSCLTPFNDGLQ